MKRLIISLLYGVFFVAVAFLGCKKPQPVNPTFSIKSSALAGGVIDPSGTVNVSKGSDQTYKITPNTGYTIASVTVDGSPISTASSYTFTNVTASHTISATFAAVIVNYTITVTSGQNGTVTSSATQVAAGGGVTITAVPNAGYHTDSLWIDGVFSKLLAGVNTYTLGNVQANHTLKVSFTDALSAHALDSLRNLLINGGHWYDRRDSTKVHGSSGGWQVLPIPSCATDAYFVFFANGTYEEHAGSNPCTLVAPGALIGSATYTMSPNGKQIVFNINGGGTSISYYEEISANQLIYTNTFSGYDFKFVSGH